MSPGTVAPHLVIAAPPVAEIADSQLRRIFTVNLKGFAAISSDGRWICGWRRGMLEYPFSARIFGSAGRLASQAEVPIPAFPTAGATGLTAFNVEMMATGAVAVSIDTKTVKQGWQRILTFCNTGGRTAPTYRGEFGDPFLMAAANDRLFVASASPGPANPEATRIRAFSSTGQEKWRKEEPGWLPMALAAAPNLSRIAVGMAHGSYADGTLRRRTVFYDQKGKLVGEAEGAATEITFSPDAKHLAGLRDYDLALFDAKKGKLAWIKTLQVDGVPAPAEAVAPADGFMAVITRRPGKDKQGNPATVRSVHLLDYNGETLWHEDFSTTPDGQDLGQPGVTLSPDGSLMALWERDRVWTYRVTRQ